MDIGEKGKQNYQEVGLVIWKLVSNLNDSIDDDFAFITINSILLDLMIFNLVSILFQKFSNIIHYVWDNELCQKWFGIEEEKDQIAVKDKN